jgi:pimeloyl-ACP methyl ester carboxylesterase
MNPYDYIKSDSFHLEMELSPRGGQHYSIEFTSACSLPYPENNQARGEYYHPGKDKTPLVILLHGLGDQSVLPCKLLAGYLAGCGMASFILYLPFHSRRLVREQLQRFPVLSPEEWFEIYRVSVINVRQVLDWADNRPEINKEKVGLFGISLGGFVSAITMGIDDRVQAGIFTVTGGNSARISQWSQRYGTKRGFSRTPEEYEETLRNYYRYLAEVAEKGFENAVPSDPFFMTDPLTFAPMLRQYPLFMVNATWDEAIPRAATIEFWEACGRPPIMWLPGTHATIWAYYPLIRRRIREFLDDSFRS